MTLHFSHPAIRRGRRTVLEAAAFSLPCPAALGVVGINGSGKSSLFMHIAGMLGTFARRPAGGALRLGDDGADAGPSLAIVPQEPALPSWLHVERVSLLYGTTFDQLDAAMPSLFLQELRGRRAGALSTGQRQAFAVALALSRDAALTIFDEPFAALDFRRRIGVLDLLRQRRAAGGSIMVSSQSAADLADLCDHFIVIREGRYAFCGPRADLAAADDPIALERSLLTLLT